MPPSASAQACTRSWAMVPPWKTRGTADPRGTPEPSKRARADVKQISIHRNPQGYPPALLPAEAAEHDPGTEVLPVTAAPAVRHRAAAEDRAGFGDARVSAGRPRGGAGG